jgi:iron-sulfur cluster assembly accessory protein
MTLPNGMDTEMNQAATATPEVVLTDRAAKRVSRILSKEPEGTVLRISVAGGGCSGFQYEYNLVQEKPASDDIVLSKGDAIVLIDSMSLEFMGGAEIDFVDDLIGQAFQIKNPNAVASCGCGTSFAV